MKKIPHVALLIETSNGPCRSILQGIAAFIREQHPWSVYLGEHQRGAPVPGWLRQWEGDGIIARVENEDIARVLLETELPIVNVSSVDFETMHGVRLDEEALARTVVDHLLERGYQEFAFCGVAGFEWSVTREKLFSQLVRESNCKHHVYDTSTSNRRIDWEKEQTRVAQWLQRLPKPVGLFASYDFRGQQVLDACRRAEIAVPEQVAVVSVGDDELLCEFTMPPMSSVTCNVYSTGYQAASVLDQLMAGKVVEPRVRYVKPFGVHLRQSTDIMAIDDPDIITALQIIRLCACDGIKVGNILAKVHLSRRKLEWRFQKLVGRTIHDEILRVKLTQAKRLVSQSKLPLTDIACRTGFSQASHMGRAFRKELGLSPSEYRKQFQGESKPH